MKSNKMLLVNGIASILGGLLILYASSKRWHWEIVALVPKMVENSGWGGLIVLTSLLFLGLSIVGMAQSIYVLVFIKKCIYVLVYVFNYL